MELAEVPYYFLGENEHLVYWYFRDATCRKSMFFFGKNYELGNKAKKRYYFKTAESRNLNFRTSMGHIQIIFCANLEAIGRVIRVSKPKTETPIGGLNRSS